MRGQPRTTHAIRGRNIEHDVTISLEEAFRGTTISLQWENGRRVEAKIPPGVRTGSRVRLRGQGESSPDGTQSGDLFLKIQVRPHAAFERDGNDLKVTVPVSLYTALLGGKTNIQTIDRTVELTIPPETSNGKTFRLRGLGMPDLRKPDQRGNLYATVNIELPKNLSAKERELFQQLQELRMAHK